MITSLYSTKISTFEQINIVNITRDVHNQQLNLIKIKKKKKITKQDHKNQKKLHQTRKEKEKLIQYHKVKKKHKSIKIELVNE